MCVHWIDMWRDVWFFFRDSEKRENEKKKDVEKGNNKSARIEEKKFEEKKLCIFSVFTCEQETLEPVNLPVLIYLKCFYVKKYISISVVDD